MPALHSAAADRNKQAILEVLQRVLPAQGSALEIASGTGQHAAYFAMHMPGWIWQPSDIEAANLESVNLRVGAAGLANLLRAITLNVLNTDWQLPARLQAVDAIFCANMLHIAPWACCGGLMQGAARHLAPQGRLVTYGPYIESNIATAASNLAFDSDLRARNPDWGLRQLDAVAQTARQAGLELIERISMPANNLMLVFARATVGALRP
jgi:hypothetical protein